ncbi:MAG: isopeptide-forming domain-containing fimbrial protein [Solobacterium sp.]|jgi:fimbrial isopeptide formation D2 family protein/LPXTG-motif cell wall-anchored protein|nr:isopeptide-forming domain-containing fimbrial protein [Solobacterium sp.]
MKTLKKLTNLFISLFMVFALTTTVFAGGDDTTGTSASDTGTTGNSLTINNTGNTAHTLELYQIFTGDLSNGTLSNIKWGSGVTDAGKSALGDAATKAGGITDATTFANEVKQYLTNATTSTSVAAGSSYKFDNLAAGYYLVKDVDGSQKDTAGAYTSYIVQVVGSVTQNTKLDVPTVVKKVKDTNDSTGVTTDWQDSADYDIGDAVPYQITGTLPSNIDKYTTYKYVFTDTMSKGLTYTAGKAKITIGDKDVTSSFTETVTANTDDRTTVTWACDDMKGIEGVTLNNETKVVVSYTAKLNDNAVLGSAGNPNEVDLTYSNNPNKGGEGETGKTPKDKNIVFTYKTIVNKVDQDKKSLAGAAFKLEKKNSDGSYNTVKEFTADKETSFEFKGLDDGDYKLTETTTPAGYNTITPIEFTISAEHDADSADPKLKSLTGKLTSGEAIFTADKDAGSLTTDVVNKKGSTLPSTGGIGTTIFYAAGGALVVLAGVMIAARKRA